MPIIHSTYILNKVKCFVFLVICGDLHKNDHILLILSTRPAYLSQVQYQPYTKHIQRPTKPYISSLCYQPYQYTYP